MRPNFKDFIIFNILGLFCSCPFFITDKYSLPESINISVAILLTLNIVFCLVKFIATQYNKMTPNNQSRVIQISGLIALIIAILRACTEFG